MYVSEAKNGTNVTNQRLAFLILKKLSVTDFVAPELVLECCDHIVGSGWKITLVCVAFWVSATISVCYSKQYTSTIVCSTKKKGPYTLSVVIAQNIHFW